MLTYGLVLLIISAATCGLATSVVLISLFAGNASDISASKYAIALTKGIFFTVLFTVFAATFAGPQHLAMLVIGAVLYGLGLVSSMVKIVSSDYSGCISILLDLAMMTQYIVVAALI